MNNYFNNSTEAYFKLKSGMLTLDQTHLVFWAKKQDAPPFGIAFNEIESVDKYKTLATLFKIIFFPIAIILLIVLAIISEGDIDIAPNGVSGSRKMVIRTKSGQKHTFRVSRKNKEFANQIKSRII
jgi:hypothetical protein